MIWELVQDNGGKSSNPSSSVESPRCISHHELQPPHLQVFWRTTATLLKPYLFWRGTSESTAGILSGFRVFPMPFLPVLIKILCDLFTAKTIHYTQAGRNNQLVFQAMIFSQETEVEQSQFYTNILISWILQKVSVVVIIFFSLF